MLTQIVCPMCGKFMSSTSPSLCDDRDICSVEVKGLGRGKGVEVLGTNSVFDEGYSEVAHMFAERVLTLLDLLLEKGYIEPDEVYELLPEGDEVEDDEEDLRDEVIDEYVDEVDNLNLRKAQAKKELAEAEENLRKVTQQY